MQVFAEKNSGDLGQKLLDRILVDRYRAQRSQPLLDSRGCESAALSVMGGTHEDNTGDDIMKRMQFGVRRGCDGTGIDVACVWND